jgi:hypothetical protein
MHTNHEPYPIETLVPQHVDDRFWQEDRLQTVENV